MKNYDATICPTDLTRDETRSSIRGHSIRGHSIRGHSIRASSRSRLMPLIRSLALLAILSQRRLSGPQPR